MDEQCSRIFYTPSGGGGLRTCAVSQSTAADRFSAARPVSDGLYNTNTRRPASPDDTTSAPCPAPSDLAHEPTAPGGVPWPSDSRVAPLFELSLRLAAGRLDRVESLVGFPEMLAEPLVRRALRLGAFDRADEKCRHALAVCVAAFPDQVLPCLRLSDHLTLSEYEEPLEPLWAGLTRLDLSGCRLGDKHPVLAHIATNSRLTHLYLRGCALTDTGLRNLTLPARMSGVGLTALRRIDVRDNQLSHRALQMLCRLKPDQVAASVTVNADAKADLEQRGYRLVEPFPADDVTTEGWLSELVDRWSRLAVRPPTKRARTESSNASRFYGRPVSAKPASAPAPRETPRWPAAVYLQSVSATS